MGILSFVKLMPSLLMNKLSSVFLAADAVSNSLFDFGTLLTNLLTKLAQFFYFSTKWAMYLIDVMYFYILQLAGVTMDTSSLSAMTSADSDMVFNFLINNGKMVSQIIRNFIGIAIIIIIVCAIIAIIKNNISSLGDKSGGTKVNTVVKSMMKAFFFIIITPIVAIMGILASNILLKSLFNATNLSNTNSLSARIFNVSATAANRYRIYAEDGVRVPVKFDFDGENRKDAINFTVNVFGNNYFPQLSSFNESQYRPGVDNYLTYGLIDNLENIDKRNKEGNSFTPEGGYFDNHAEFESKYYEFFDHGNSNDKYAKFEAYPEEYLVMADVIEYAMDTMEPVYFTTIQDVLESVQDSESLFRNLIDVYNIRLYNDDPETTNPIRQVGITYNFELLRDDFKKKNYKYIVFDSKYANQDHTYVHIKNATDEVEGAKYIISTASQTDSYSVSKYGTYFRDGSLYKDIGDIYIQDGTNYEKVELYYERKFNIKKLNFEYTKADSIQEGQTYYYKNGNDYEKMEGTDFYFEYDDIYYDLETTTRYEKTVENIYSPLYAGYRYDESVLETNYIETGNIIVAKGIFTENGYPTAIYKTTAGDIMFYRDELEYASSKTVTDAAGLEQTQTDENGGIMGALGAGINFITSLFKPASLVPDLSLDPSKLALEYTNKTINVFTLTGGRLHISYFFSDALTSSMSKSLYGISLSNLFNPLSINYLVLVVGTAIFLKICFQSVFALIARSLDLFMLILIYPLATATIPLLEGKDGKGTNGYSKWVDSFIRKLLSTYGLVLAINFAFLIIPIIDSIEFFTINELQNNLAATRLSKALMTIGRFVTFGNFELQYSQLVKFLNGILSIMFQLAIFSVIAPVGKGGQNETFYGAIQNIAGGADLDNNAGTEMVKIVKNVAKTVNFIVSPPNQKFKMVLEKAQAALSTVAENLPGSAIAKAAVQKTKEMTEEANKRTAKKELLESLKSKEDPTVVQEKLDVFNKAYGLKISLGNKAPKDKNNNGNQQQGGGDDQQQGGGDQQQQGGDQQQQGGGN